MNLLDTIVETKKGVKLYARRAESKDIDDLTRIINWAYRGKEGANPWTTEKHLVKGQRINEAALTKELLTDPLLKTIVLVELVEEENGAEPVDQNQGEQQQQRRIVGTIKIERDTLEDTSGMIGMFGVDPSLQSSGIGGVLFKIAENYIKNTWGLNSAVMHVISIRDELLNWYISMGYSKTGKVIPFHNKDDKLDRALVENLEFNELAKPL
ncbi:hypothetical protein PPL_09252 [Heterostelium album PN500]|uniref:N-acetyltransferase domain-containing protein n=1 Tax=Heterostelium pallidum (strain ATCC 26659 / Pp 5 / PN500) TaxID=670386 RepID=D3BL20_HETP5|nr:hypothetical protein PPL_09252 [Heterostelium album PN500]EFA77754.1 hypothetical protein PPL_09252 [Heterostelium album PN500]|eukprot:XP_020429882.1 hypothetical protein PPL_09252 [Heterostelium album PN500]